MTAFRIAAAAGLAGLVTACAPTLGPRPPGLPSGPPPDFRASDFAWAQKPGGNQVVGRLAARRGAGRLTCAGQGVVLTPETPWSRARMAALYGSTERAAAPADEVRARTPSAPPGDAGPFIKRSVCDSNDRFSFTGLPDGAWYVIVLARPAGQADSDGVALMRRITTRGGRVTTVEL